MIPKNNPPNFSVLVITLKHVLLWPIQLFLTIKHSL